MLTDKHRQLKLATDKAVSGLTNLDNLAKDVLDLVVSDVLTKFHHKLGAGVEDSVADLLDDFKLKVVDQIINEASNWKIPKSDIVIFPRNCRFFYEKADSTIVVIEDDPRKRTVKLANSLVERIGLTTGLPISQRRTLPFPYVVYIFHIRSNRLCNTYIGWRSTPLMKTEDKLARPILPNCHENLEVCWGLSQRPLGNSIAELCENAINQYWSSEFNNDLSDCWNRRAEISEDLHSIQNWSNKSTLDMLSLNYSRLGDPTIEDKIKQIAGHVDEPDMDKIKHRLFELTEKHSEILFSKMIRYFKKVKPDRFYPKSVTDLLKDSLESCTKDYLDVFFLLQYEYNKIDRRIKESEGTLVKKIGHFWT